MKCGRLFVLQLQETRVNNCRKADCKKAVSSKKITSIPDIKNRLEKKSPELGAIVAIVLGVTGTALGGIAMARYRRQLRQQ